MNDEKIEKAKDQLGPYGYTLTDAFQIEKGGKIFSVVVSNKGPRFYVKQLSGAPLWSGPDLGEFVKSFWYAKKIEQPMKTNGRGIYHETAAGKHDMVIHQDHRGAWRIDLVTSVGGNHTDVTGPNRGYGSAEEAFQAALDVQRTRGIRGKSHVFIADRDGNLSDYEPMEANGRSSSATAQDLEAAYYYNERKIADAEEELRRPGISQEYRQQLRDMIASAKSDMEYAGSRMQTNGRATTVDPVAARELDLYIANTWDLVGKPGGPGKSIDANLKRKLAAGTYDSALAPKAWQCLVDEGAKRYQKEFGSDSPIFNAATRRQVAADFARAWEEENGMRANGSPVRPGEKLVGKAIGQHGQVLATFKGDAIRPLIARLDAAHPNSWGASISGEYTSDGTHHGLGKGRVVASREPRTVDGRFYSGWIIE